MRIGIIVTVLVLLMAGCTKDRSSVENILEVPKNFKFPSHFPQDPGKKGDESLLGIDSDNDGVRDDLQRWIYSRYPNHPEKRNALSQLARLYQTTLSFDPAVEDKKVLMEKASRAINCLDLRFEGLLDLGDAYKERRYLRAKALNTFKRTKRFLEVDSKLSGVYPAYEGYPCDE